MRSATGIIYNDAFLKHDTGPGHPETADRLRRIVSHLRETGLWQRLQHPIIDAATEEAILRNHARSHLERIRDACRTGKQLPDDDTRISADSFEAAMLAAGGVITAVDAVMHGILRNAFCAVRPPGHHAEYDRATGFCLFNNIAIAARHARNAFGLKRVAIVDWDVHHGNGTQHSFEDDPSVLVINLHQYPHYPGTGSREEIGTGAGREYTLNIPMKAGSGDTEYCDAFRREVIPLLDGYRPELILISAGFDAHRDDPLGGINLTEAAYSTMTDLLVADADRYCSGRIISILEGGYNFESLARSVEAHLRGLMGNSG